MSNTESWLHLLGRLHPVVLHLPIGVLIALAVLEVFAQLRRRPLERSVRLLIAWIAAVGAVLAAVSGWFLAEQPEYGGGSLILHRNLGIALAACTSLAALALLFGSLRVYGVLLVAALALLVPVGHLGGSMVHGEQFLAEPLRAAIVEGGNDGSRGPVELYEAREQPLAADHRAGKAVGVDAHPDVYTTGVAPLFAARCVGCHGSRRQRGGLRLDSYDALMAGGDDGAVVVPGDPGRSELVRRLQLPADDDDHMPPPPRPQLTLDETRTISQWIADGALAPASDEHASANLTAALHPTSAATAEADEAQAAQLRAREQQVQRAVDALAASQVHVEVIDPASGGLWVDYRAVPTTDQATLMNGLLDLMGDVDELSVAGTAVGDESMGFLGCLSGMKRLDLSRTPVTSEGIAELAPLHQLEFLGLSGTAVDDDALDVLAELPALRRVALWDTGVSDAGRARLAEQRPEVEILAAQPAEALEVEPELVFGDPTKLTAVNTMCPVSGAPVDPAILVVFDGDVVGFCCTECPSTFWADPSAYPVSN